MARGSFRSASTATLSVEGSAASFSRSLILFWTPSCSAGAAWRSSSRSSATIRSRSSFTRRSAAIASGVAAHGRSASSALLKNAKSR